MRQRLRMMMRAGHHNNVATCEEPRSLSGAADWEELGRLVRSKALEAVSLHLAAIGALNVCEGDVNTDAADGGSV